jgi:hypothetical protein
MDNPRRKIRVVGERRLELDIARFADALIAFALHRLQADPEAAEDNAAKPTKEAS